MTGEPDTMQQKMCDDLAQSKADKDNTRPKDYSTNGVNYSAEFYVECNIDSVVKNLFRDTNCKSCNSVAGLVAIRLCVIFPSGSISNFRLSIFALAIIRAHASAPTEEPATAPTSLLPLLPPAGQTLAFRSSPLASQAYVGVASASITTPTVVEQVHPQSYLLQSHLSQRRPYQHPFTHDQSSGATTPLLARS